MSEPISVEMARQLVDRLASGPSDRSRRLAITSLTNLFFEVWSQGRPKTMDETQVIVAGLCQTAANRSASLVLRLSSLRSLARMLEHLQQFAPPPDSAQSVAAQPVAAQHIAEQLTSLARRRQDDADVLRLARETVNRWRLTPASRSRDTAIADETQQLVCPLYPALNRRQPALSRWHAALAQEVTAILAAAAGYRPSTFDEGVEIATRINELAARYGLRMTPADDSELAVTLSFRKIGGANPGAFVFRTSDSTRYAGITVPAIRVVPT